MKTCGSSPKNGPDFFLWISEFFLDLGILVGFKTHLRMVIYEVCGMLSFAS